MAIIDPETQLLLAELNRRVLAGRPMAAADLQRLETLYASIKDVWCGSIAGANAGEQATVNGRRSDIPAVTAP